MRDLANKRSYILPTGIFVFFSIVIAAATFFYYNFMKAEIEENYGKTLTSVTKLKIKEISNFRSERIADATFLFKNEEFTRKISRLLADTSDTATRAILNSWLDQLQKNHNYIAIQVLNRQRQIVFTTGIDPEKQFALNNSKHQIFENYTKPVFIDLHKDITNHYIQTYTPIYRNNNESDGVIAAVVFTIDPLITFFPMVTNSPIPTKTGESLLVRREKDSIFFISPLRFNGGDSLEDNRSVCCNDFPADTVLMGETRYSKGIDYRGVEVLFYSESVPNTAWIMITKIDLSEVYAGIQQPSYLLFTLMFALLLFSGALLFYFLKNQNIKTLRYSVESATAELQLNRIYELISLVNAAIARTNTKDELLKNIADISVSKGGYIYCVIISQQTGGERFQILAESVNEKSKSQHNMMHGELIGTIISHIKNADITFIVDDINSFPFTNEEKNRFKEKGIRSFALYPLKPDNKYIGNIFLFSENLAQFNERESALLDKLATDVSLGLHGLDEHEKIAVSERIIKDTEIRYRNLIENSPDAILINYQGKIVLINKAALKLFRADSESEILGKNPIDLFTPEFRPIIVNRIQYMKNTRKPVPAIEEKIVCMDKSVLDVEVVAAPYSVGDDIAIHVIMRDISERKKQEDMLREKEERLRFSLEAANQGIYDLKIATGETVVNDQYALMLGYNPEIFKETNNAWIERLHPDDREQAAGAYKDYIEGRNTVYRVEFRQKTVDGSWKWILSLGKIIEYDSNGKPVRMLGTHTDITDKKDAEYKLLIQSKMLNQVGQSIISISVKGKILYWNNKAGSEFGWLSDEAIGKNLLELLVPAEGISHINTILEQVKSGKSWSGEIVLKKKEGSEFTAEAVISPFYQNFGKLLGLIIVAQDITEKRKTEQQIRNLSLAVEQSPVSILITKLDGTIIYSNKRTNDLTGYSNEELLGQNPRIFSSHELDQTDYKNMWESILAGNEWKGEFHNKKKNGELFWEWASISPIRDENDEIVFFLGVKEDITEQKKLVAELIRSKNRAEELNQIKTNFLANMSHELRTPLIAILGFSEIMINEESDEEKIGHLNSIYNGGERLLKTVNSLLTFSNFTRSGVTLTLKPMKADRFSSSLDNIYRPKAEKKGLLFTNNCSSTETIFSDCSLLMDAISYILDNAIRFTQKGEVSFSASSTENNFLFSIKDTGIGILPDKLKIIFEEFRQASEGFSRHYEGSGLGLTLANKYIQLLGGSLQVVSHLGKGSEFIINLPKNPIQNFKNEELIP